MYFLNIVHNWKLFYNRMESVPTLARLLLQLLLSLRQLGCTGSAAGRLRLPGDLWPLSESDSSVKTSVGIEVWTPEVLNELEVTVEGEDTGGKKGEVEGELALGFPAEDLEKGAWGQGFPAAVVCGDVAMEEEEHEDVVDEDGMGADAFGGGGGLLFGRVADCEVDAALGSGKQAEEWGNKLEACSLAFLADRLIVLCLCKADSRCWLSAFSPSSVALQARQSYRPPSPALPTLPGTRINISCRFTTDWPKKQIDFRWLMADSSFIKTAWHLRHASRYCALGTMYWSRRLSTPLLSISCCSEDGFLLEEEEEEEEEVSQEGVPFCSSAFAGSLADSLRLGVPGVWGGTGVWLTFGCWSCWSCCCCCCFCCCWSCRCCCCSASCRLCWYCW